MNLILPNDARRVKTDLRPFDTHFERKSDINSQLPPRSTRLLNRSRLNQGSINANGLESPRSIENLNLINCKTSSRLSPQLGRDSANGSPDDQLFMLDKTLRNSMIQDVQYCKQQLLQLRSILQETTSLNSFETNNGKFFDISGGYDGIINQLEPKERDNYSPSLSDDPKHDLVDLRRQVVYLQGQLDDKDRTIRIQQNLITKLEAEMSQTTNGKNAAQTEQMIETVNIATQTDRVRPLSMNFDGTNSNRSEDGDVMIVVPETISASSSSSSLSSVPKSPLTLPNKFKLRTVDNSKMHADYKKTEFNHDDNDGIPNTVIGKKILFENNLQKASENMSRYNSTTPYSSLTNIPRTHVNRESTDGSSSMAREKFLRNILGNSTNHSDNNSDINTQVNRMSSIKSVKLLNNINVLKSKGFQMPSKHDSDS